MKFYYKEQLVRTSKTRHYKYAVGTIKKDGSLSCWSCHETRESAEKQMQSKRNECRRIAQSNREWAKKSEENMEYFRKFYGSDYDPDEQYKAVMAGLGDIKVFEIEER